MDFNDARLVDSICFQMRQADWPRALNRRRINDLFNGAPPYSEQEAVDNSIEVNVNDMSGIVAAHDARAQLSSGFLTPGNYYKTVCSRGPKHKRPTFTAISTREVNRIMKRSLPYTECFRSKFAMLILHGISPTGWRCQDGWCPDPLAIEDVMIPARTLLTMRNLPFFAVYRSFTGPELVKLTRGPLRDPGWNMPLVEQCLKYIDETMVTLQGSTWQEIWSPEKLGERLKGDGGFYASDEAPTIDCWDFYWWNDDDGVEGWNRRMILDSWTNPGITDAATAGTWTKRTGSLYGKKNLGEFLYNPGKRKVANGVTDIVTWQFADLSAVAPFRYHTVRSLGYLLYAICHLQNRLYCKFSEAQFEQLMIYFRVRSQDDMQRALKVDLVNRGFIDDTVEFIPHADRYQVNTQLIDLGLKTNNHLINRNSSSYTANATAQGDKRTLTATQWIGEANKVTALVSSALNQAYIYQAEEYRQIFRRFCRKDSKDADVRKFQANCLQAGLPEKLLYDYEAWDIEPERMVGAGNKTLEMAIADWLMGHINLFDPEPQQLIKRTSVLAVTGDASMADALVPEAPTVNDAIHDAQLASGAIMMGLPVAMKTGINHIDYVETLMTSMAVVIQRIQQRDNTGTVDEVVGLQNMNQHIQQHIEVIAQDPNERARVKAYGDQLGKMMNLVKAFAQRIAEQQQQQAANGGMDPETQAKIQAMLITAQAKAENTRTAHAQRTAQRQVQWEMEQQRKAEEAAVDLDIKTRQQQMDLVAQSTKAQIDIAKQAAANPEKPTPPKSKKK